MGSMLKGSKGSRGRVRTEFEAYGERAVLETICHGRASIPIQRGCSFPLRVARFSSPCATTARKAAAVKLMRKLLKKPGFVPDLMATDKLRSYGAAKAETGLCGLATSRACASTIGLRIHIGRRDCPSERLELDWRCI